jgi:CBS domain containing-hemolysin-like protein
LGLTVLISLFQDYRDVPQAYTLPIYGGVFIFFLIIGFIFLSSLELIPKENAVSYQENIDAFIMATIGITSLSVLLKYKIIKIKYRET